MRKSKYTEIVMRLFVTVFASVYGLAWAEQVERECEPEDLFGTWQVVGIKNRKELPSEYFDLLQPYQLISYGETGTFRRITFSKRIEQNEALRLLASVPDDKFLVQKDSVIATTNQDGKVLESYGCSYFIRDNPRVNITKGTLSLMWTFEGKPAVLQTYRKIDKQQK